MVRWLDAPLDGGQRPRRRSANSYLARIHFCLYFHSVKILFFINFSHMQTLNANQLEERRFLILRYRSVHATAERKRWVKFGRLNMVLSLITTLFIATCLTLSVCSELFGWGILDWQNMGLMVVLGLGPAILLGFALFEYRLEKHLQRMENKSAFEGLAALNHNLEALLKQIYKAPMWSKTLLIGLVGMILIMGFLQQGGNNPYWTYMQLPVLLFFWMRIYQVGTKYSRLNRNLKAVEDAF